MAYSHLRSTMGRPGRTYVWRLGLRSLALCGSFSTRFHPRPQVDSSRSSIKAIPQAYQFLLDIKSLFQEPMHSNCQKILGPENHWPNFFSTPSPFPILLPLTPPVSEALLTSLFPGLSSHSTFYPPPVFPYLAGPSTTDGVFGIPFRNPRADKLMQTICSNSCVNSPGVWFPLSSISL
jgi:hypothetical protein